jgi:hypothetical protein
MLNMRRGFLLLSATVMISNTVFAQATNGVTRTSCLKHYLDLSREILIVTHDLTEELSGVIDITSDFATLADVGSNASTFRSMEGHYKNTVNALHRMISLQLNVRNTFVYKHNDFISRYHKLDEQCGKLLAPAKK